ncbi:MAG: RDD family protein [Chloroflexi bacterium]|nr:MAG: RDD family protein [Chloroflexota bacterium]
MAAAGRVPARPRHSPGPMIAGSPGSTAAGRPVVWASSWATVRWNRFLALIADILILSILDAIVNGTFGVTRVTSGFTSVTDPMTSGGYSSFTTATEIDGFFLLLIWIGYFDLQGQPATFGRILLRNLIRPIDALPFAYLLGGALVLFSRDHQRLGDRVAGTLVVRAEEVTGPSLVTGLRRRVVAVLAGLAVFLVVCAAFQYWGRPPLVIDGLQHTGELFSQPISSYTLGSARWGPGSVTYPITFTSQRTNQTCTGEIELHWTFLGGWNEQSGQYNCPGSSFP